MGLLDSRSTHSDDPEEINYQNWPTFPPIKPEKRQSSSSIDASSIPTLITILAAFILANVLLSIVPRLKGPTLEDDPMCGIPTGGKEECYFDCVSTYNKREPSIRLIKNLDCLEDCFDGLEGKECIKSLLEDIKKKGVCDLESATTGIDPGSGVYDVNDACIQHSSNALVPDIKNGTCSPETEEKLKNPKCRQLILKQPAMILNTATELINSACSKEVSPLYVDVKVQYKPENCGCDIDPTIIDDYFPQKIPNNIDLPPFPWKPRKNDPRFPNLRTDKTLPISLNFNSTDITLTTMFDFSRTLNRYSWICSLRSTDPKADHFCAVTLLSLPPKPTVIVGPAHCTYICKNGAMRIPSCCCQTDTTDCREDVKTCGNNPRVVEMSGSDSQVLCGEWEIGTTPPAVSGEKKNVALEVLEIIRHPNFDTKNGPIKGSDIAIIKVDDEKLRNGGALRYNINPACFSNKISNRGRQSENQEAPFGIQAGWSNPPPLKFLMEYASDYVPLYRDFSKQWHYRMDFVECQDPANSTFGPLKCPSNTSYPAATMCAKDFAKQACFSPGESGSPLMVEEKVVIGGEEKGKFHTKGIFSFVKGRGCDIYSNNPSAYTKLSCFLPWIAKEYGMKYEPEEKYDPQCTQETPGTISDDPECLVPESKSRLFGKMKVEEKCQNTPSNLQEYYAGEQDCIFPFYYNGQKYDKCILFTEAGFTYPAFRCPVHNITTKRDGINDFTIRINKTATLIQNRECPSFGCQIFQTPTYCALNPEDQFSDLDPDLECDIVAKRAPFSVCKNNCPGVGSLGLIGGGALAFFSTAFVGQAVLAPTLGFGGLGLFGLMMANQNCFTPFCRARSGQCCMLQLVSNRLRCPSRC